MKPNNTTIENLTWKSVVRPMRTTFATSRGTKTRISSVMVTATCSDSAVGLGEVSTSFVLPRETIGAIKKVLTAIKPKLCGQLISNWSSLTAAHRKQFPDFHMTCSGLEVALFRAYLAANGKSELAWWGNKRKSIETDITIPFVSDITALLPWLKRVVHTGFDTYKVKVSGNIKQDVDFICSIWIFLTESNRLSPLRLDGNQGFTADSAMRLLDRLEKLSIPVELFEQPLKQNDYKGMKQLYQKIPVPLIADETVFSEADCKRVINDQLAHGVNIKIAKSGITESRKILKTARRAKLKLMIGCMTETLTGLSAGIYAAAGSGAFDYIDLDSVHFLYPSKKAGSITIEGPMYHIGELQ